MVASFVAPRALLCIMRDRQVVLELPELEQRLSNLQSQVERLWRKAEANVPPIEQRLAAMADQYAEYLKRWAATVERHSNAVAQLEAYASEWKDANVRVRQETADRLHELETTIDPITNSGIQIRTQVRLVQGTGRGFESAPGRVKRPRLGRGCRGPTLS